MFWLRNKKLNSASDQNSVCLTGVGKAVLVMFDGHSASLIDLTDGNTIGTVDGDERFEIGFPGIATGMYTYV